MNGSITLNIPQFYGIFRRGLHCATVKDISVQHVVLEDKRRNLNIEIREYMHSTMKKMMILGFTVFIRMEMILFGLNRVSMGMLFQPLSTEQSWTTTLNHV
jgi:hypothetical protein